MSIAELTGIDVPTGLLIGGEWTKGSATFPVLDPATEEPLAEVADGTAADALDAVGAAQAALPGWAATPPRQRAEILRRAFELMTARAEQFARLMSAENGKSLRDARGEAAYAAEFFRWYAEEAVRIEGTLMRAPSGANKIITMHQPIGVTLLITPWNFPAAMATRKIGPALAAGCSVVLKPAEDTPLTALALAELLSEAGVPDGVVNVVTTSKPGPAVEAMLNDSAGAQALVHRVDRGRPPAPVSGVEVRGLLLDGARRQRAVHRLRGRRHRRRRRGRAAREDAQRRRGLHGGQPVLRARGGGRAVQRDVRRAA